MTTDASKTAIVGEEELALRVQAPVRLLVPVPAAAVLEASCCVFKRLELFRILV